MGPVLARDPRGSGLAQRCREWFNLTMLRSGRAGAKVGVLGALVAVALLSGQGDASAGSTQTRIPPPVLLETKIEKGPDQRTTAREAYFEISRTIDNLECSLDYAPFVSCTTPLLLTGLTLGEHVLAARVVYNGEVDPTPAYWFWRVVPPERKSKSKKKKKKRKRKKRK